MIVKTRFAPSPTGYLHVGNIRTALVNWLYARAHAGKFVLRIDDTDLERSKQEYTDAIIEDMKWLGLEWDEIYYQSQRTQKYEDAKRSMVTSGRLYPCFESQEELEIKKKSALSRNLPPIYDRAALHLSKADIEAKLAKGEKSHWRFFLNSDAIEWNDGVRGAMHFDPTKISDPILVRGDGTMTYMIASVVDDIDLGITDIIRGEDHISNTAIHTQMFKALGAKEMPRFAHLSRIHSKEGKISKRLGGFDVRSLRESGIQPLVLLSFLAKLGTSDSIAIATSVDELIASFDIEKFSKAPSTYDLVDVERLNTKFLHAMNFEDIKAQLSNKDIDAKFWNEVKANLEHLSDIELWWKICKEKIEPVITNKELNANLIALLPTSEFDETTFQNWVNDAKSKLGVGGKELFMSIRLSLTAIDHGPELKKLLPLLGRNKVIGRMNGQSI